MLSGSRPVRALLYLYGTQVRTLPRIGIGDPEGDLSNIYHIINLPS